MWSRGAPSIPGQGRPELGTSSTQRNVRPRSFANISGLTLDSSHGVDGRIIWKSYSQWISLKSIENVSYLICCLLFWNVPYSSYSYSLRTQLFQKYVPVMNNSISYAVRKEDEVVKYILGNAVPSVPSHGVTGHSHVLKALRRSEAGFTFLCSPVFPTRRGPLTFAQTAYILGESPVSRPPHEGCL